MINNKRTLNTINPEMQTALSFLIMPNTFPI